MEKQNTEQLKKLAKIFNTANVITSEDIQEVLKGILQIMNSFKKDNEKLTSETKNTVGELFDKLIIEHEKVVGEVTTSNRTTKDDVLKEFDQKIKEVKSLMAEVMLMKPLDGEDADHDAIVAEVLTKIKLPEYKETVLDDGQQIADKLNALDEVIDQKVIKGLTRKISDLSSNIAHNAVQKGAKLYTGPSEARVLELIADNTSPSAGGTVGPGTINEIAYFDTTSSIASLAVATYPSLTELSYVKGVTSAIQTQLDAKLTSANIVATITNGDTTHASSSDALFDALALKAPLTSPTFATSITGSYLTASEILITDGSKNIVSAAVATYPSLTELTYLKGVTSAIQTQLGNKQPLDTQLTAIAALADASGVLTNDGAGNMSWAAAAGGVTIGDTVTSGTAGSVLYLGASNVLAQSNSNFYFDYTNNYLKLATATNSIVIGGDITGNARGANTIDLQTTRSAVTQVASGASGGTFGSRNTASGTNYAFAIGRQNIASSSSCFAIGKDLNNSTGEMIMIGFGTKYVAIGNGIAGLNTQSPTAAWHLPAGTTAASTSPLKFTSGSLMTAPEAGAVEFLTDAFYGTITTGAARKTFAFLESPVLTTPTLGVATATSINGLTITSSTGTLTVTNAKTLTVSNSLTLAGTDGKGINVGAATSGKILIGDGSNMILSTPTYPTAAGSSGNVLTSDGTNWTSASPSAGATIPKFVASTSFETAARFTATAVNSGTTTFTTNGCKVSTGASATSSERISWVVGNSDFEVGSPSFSCSINNDTMGTDFQAYFGLGVPTVAGTGITYTAKHIGFKIIRVASGNVNLYATQADGTTETASASLGNVNSSRLELTLQVNSTTSVDYYWRDNGVGGNALSAATNLTTNMPTGLTNQMMMAVSNVSTATNTDIYCYAAVYQR